MLSITLSLKNETHLRQQLEKYRKDQRNRHQRYQRNSMHEHMQQLNQLRKELEQLGLPPRASFNLNYS